MSNTLSIEEMNHELFQPQTNNIFHLEIEGVPAYLVKTVSRPSFTISEQDMNWGNAPTRKVSTGRVTFGTLEVELWESINPSAAQLVMAWIRAHTDNVSGRASYSALHKRDIVLAVGDPMGNIVQRWFYKNCHLNSVEFSDLDHEADGELTSISLSISYDNVFLLH